MDTQRSLFFFICFLLCLWIVLDQFWGDKRIASWSKLIFEGIAAE